MFEFVLIKRANGRELSILGMWLRSFVEEDLLLSLVMITVVVLLIMRVPSRVNCFSMAFYTFVNKYVGLV